MNYITNDNGEAVISVGEKGSRARTAAEYPNLINKVAEKMIKTYTENDGIYRNTQYSEIEMLCHDADVTDKITVGHIATLAFDILLKRIKQ